MTAYVISEVSIRDESMADRYRDLAATSIRRHGGRYVVRGARPVAAEGRWPDDARCVVVEFDSMAAARTWYESEDYAEARALRLDALERRLLFVDGVESS